MTPLAVGTKVRIKPPFCGDEMGLSEISTIVAIQWVTPDGLIVDDPQDDFQYLLDADEPFPDCAFRPELVEEA